MHHPGIVLARMYLHSAPPLYTVPAPYEGATVHGVPGADTGRRRAPPSAEAAICPPLLGVLQQVCPLRMLGDWVAEHSRIVQIPPCPSLPVTGAFCYPAPRSAPRRLRTGFTGTALHHPVLCQFWSAPSLPRPLEPPIFPRKAAPPSSVTRTGCFSRAGGHGSPTLRNGEGGGLVGHMAAARSPAQNTGRERFGGTGNAVHAGSPPPRAPGGRRRMGGWSPRRGPAALQPGQRDGSELARGGRACATATARRSPASHAVPLQHGGNGFSVVHPLQPVCCRLRGGHQRQVRTLVVDHGTAF